MEKQAWHTVEPKDRKRINCLDCRMEDIKSPAVACLHDHWNTGNTEGVSFWYYCLAHALQRGYQEEAL